MMFRILILFFFIFFKSSLLLAEVISDIKVSVGPPFYNTVIIPFVVIFLLFMGIGPNSKWGGKFINLKMFFLVLLASVAINIILIYFFDTKSILFNLIFISSKAFSNCFFNLSMFSAISLSFSLSFSMVLTE